VSCIISAVVCTYNRSDMLRGCLESLCQQTLDKGLSEIIVVDNNSTDNTPQVVHEFADHNIRYCLETAPGLSHARNRGLREARGKYVAYIDDDARAAADWLEVGCSLFEAATPSLDCLGGPYHPFYTSTKPDWFKDQYEVRGFGDSPKYLKNTEYLSGANMIWLKDVLNMLGGFDTNTGVVGNQLRLGEETKALNSLWSQKGDARVLFSPKLIIYHWVPDYKMTVSYRLKRRFAEGVFVGLETKKAGRSEKWKQMGRSLVYFSKMILRFLLKYNTHTHWQNWIIEDGSKLFYYTGCISALLGLNPKISNNYMG
jgi:glucosyl-dolichyl phosphate glucuronosyltransferase